MHQLSETRSPGLRPLFCVLFCLLFSALPITAQADATDTTDSAADKQEQARIDRLWGLEWRRILPFYVKHDGRYIYVPNYDKRLPSSTGLTPEAYQKDTVLEQKYPDKNGKELTRKLVKPATDTHAAVALLPDVAVGNYGYIHSGHITKILDDKTLELKSVWLLDDDAMQDQIQKLKDDARETMQKEIESALQDRDGVNWREGGIAWRKLTAENEAIDWAFADRSKAAQRQSGRLFASYTWRVIGFKTDKLTSDARWPAGKAAEAGLQLVIVDITGSTVTAVPVASIGKELTVLDAMDLLEDRGLTRQQFVELVTEIKREARADYLPQVLAKIEGMKPNNANPADKPDPTPTNDAIELAE